MAKVLYGYTVYKVEPIMGFWLVYGDIYKAQEFVEQKKREIFGDEEPWVVRFHAKEMDSLCPLIEDIRSRPLFSVRKLIVLHGISNGIEGVLTYIDNMPSSNSLIILCDNIDKRSKMYKFFNKRNAVIYLEPSNIDDDKKEIEQWCVNYLTNKGYRISSDALSLMLYRIGGNAYGSEYVIDYIRLANELDKLVAYLGEERNEIKEHDVELLVEEGGEYSIFLINKAITSGDCKGALLLFYRLLNSQGKEYKRASLCNSILYNLLSTYRALIYMDVLSRKNMRPSDIVNKACEVLYNNTKITFEGNECKMVGGRYSKPQMWAINNSYLKKSPISVSYKALTLIADALSNIRKGNMALPVGDVIALLLLRLCGLYSRSVKKHG